MDLTVFKHDTRNTTLTDAEGAPIYRVNTPPSTILLTHPDSTIFRVEDEENRAFASIRWYALSKPAAVTIRGHYVQMHRSHMLSASEIFMASDGEMYKWKMGRDRVPKLVRNDESKAVIATYSSSVGILTNRLSVLSVTQEGLSILDDIVTTFIYAGRTRRGRNHQEEPVLRMRT